jgi:mono/diheme cytochrome c family protein
LVKLAESSTDFRARLHALWTLDGIDSLEAGLVTKALSDSSKNVRVSAIRLAERWLNTPNHPLQAAVTKLLDDPDWSVRQQLAASLGFLPAGPRENAIATLLERYGDDPIVVDASLSSLRGSEAAVLDKLLASSAPTLQRETAITMLAGTIVRAGQDAAIQKLFVWLGDEAQARWQRSAVLRGAEIALLGTPMPGSQPARRAAPNAATVPCPTCPGGRAGPGGAYAFERPPAQIGGGRGGGTRIVRLNSEPSALSSMSSRTDDFATRATALLARVEWPGKPGASAAVAPLTTEEQHRFDAGRDVYRNICQTCHQPDGRGQEKVAPSLVGSTLALAAPDIPARILLNGKEGAIGLMPPVGSVLSDDQIASVLTYVRREWGQTGTAVDPAAVKNVRELTAGRTRPWTNDELLALAGR